MNVTYLWHGYQVRPHTPISQLICYHTYNFIHMLHNTYTAKCDQSSSYLKMEPFDCSPHHFSLMKNTSGGLVISHEILLAVTLKKHLNWPSTEGGKLVEALTSSLPSV